MNRFARSREAKEFLVARIVAEANKEGVPLSEVERKMLYFSETDWTLPDIEEVSEAFAREYDDDEYEKKITSLVRNARKRARKEDRQEFDAWSDAVRMLSKEDHYLLVMIEQDAPPGDLWKLWGTGLLIVGVAVVAPIFLSFRFGIEVNREALGFYFWLTATTVAIVGTLVYHFLGWRRATELMNKVTGKVFGLFDRSR